MSDGIEVDAAAMAADADTLGGAAGTVSDVRDGINTAWGKGATAFGSTPAAAAFDECCSAWIGALNSIGFLVDGLGQYTQDIATAFGATDTAMADGMERMFDEDDLPEEGKEYPPVDPSLTA